MFDLHCHILPYLDDGAKDWDESLAMCEIAKRDGIYTIVATPHIKPGVFTPSKSHILSHVDELNQRITTRNSMNSVPSIPLSDNSPIQNAKSRIQIADGSRSPTVLPGSDIHFQPDIIDQIKNNTILLLNQSPPSASGNFSIQNPKSKIKNPGTRNYILLELPDYFLFPQVRDSIIQLKEHGIIPVLSHPERNAMIQRNSKILRKLVEAGALSQVTAMSITGEFGKEIQKITKKLLKKNLVHVIASDAHSKDSRPPVLSKAVAEAARITGNGRAEMMVKDIPQAVVEGREIAEL